MNEEIKTNEETQKEDLNRGIGTKESEGLKEAKVVILSAYITEIMTKHKKTSKKVTCIVKHPDREEPVKISAVKHEKKGTLQVEGLWYNMDEDSLIRKGSALAVLLNKLEVKTIGDLVKKEINTSLDEKGYLCFKAY